jgi:DNA topoisomerase II
LIEISVSYVFAIYFAALVVGMAQDFVGSNNINLLVPSGQFGTRLTGGDDAASPRYIFTYLSPIARHLFPEVDDMLLTHREDDGHVIEPYFYCPIIPLLLVNGSEGIGTGWSTYIPPHNPHDVLAYVRAKLDDSVNLPEIRPWVRGFDGSLTLLEKGRGYLSVGKVEPQSRKTVLISELPVGRWTNDYKAHLLKMREKGEIQSFVDNHTTTKVSFTVSLKGVKLDQMMKSASGLHKAFKLQSNLLTTNMHAFGADKTILKFDSASSVADHYFPVRLALYHDRKSVLESEMNHAAVVLRNKARFIEAVSSGQIDLIGGKRSKEETVGILRELGFASVAELQEIKNTNVLAERLKVEDETDSNTLSQKGPGDYDYLLNMPLSSLTSDKINDLHSEASKTENDLLEIRKKSPKDLWRADLDKLEPYL